MMDEKMRPAPGAELFAAESFMEALANIGDSAYDSEKRHSGTVLGRRYSDVRGTWAEALALSFDDDPEDVIGWFRTSEVAGTAMSEEDVREHRSRFGKSRAYAVMIDPSQSSLAFYTVEDGEPVIVRVLVVEGN